MSCPLLVRFEFNAVAISSLTDALVPWMSERGPREEHWLIDVRSK